MRPQQNVHETLIDPFSRTHTHSTKNRVHHLTGYVPVNYIRIDFFFSFLYFRFFVVDASAAVLNRKEESSIPYFFFLFLKGEYK